MPTNQIRLGRIPISPLFSPTDEFWNQLFSGTFGAIIGSVVGAATAVTVLYFTNRHQTGLSEKALHLQRDESRRGREIAAVADLIDFLTQLSHNKAMNFDHAGREIVRHCDLLTLNAPPSLANRWRQTSAFDRLGFTRHPIAHSIGINLAIADTAMAISKSDLSKTFSGGAAMDECAQQIIRTLIRWPQLSEDEVAQNLEVALSAQENAALRFSGQVLEQADRTSVHVQPGAAFDERSFIQSRLRQGLPGAIRASHLDQCQLIERASLRAYEDEWLQPMILEADSDPIQQANIFRGWRRERDRPAGRQEESIRDATVGGDRR